MCCSGCHARGGRVWRCRWAWLCVCGVCAVVVGGAQGACVLGACAAVDAMLVEGVFGAAGGRAQRGGGVHALRWLLCRSFLGGGGCLLLPPLLTPPHPWSSTCPPPQLCFLLHAPTQPPPHFLMVLWNAGAEVVVEEFLDGEEASFFALIDGPNAVALASAQVRMFCTRRGWGCRTVCALATYGA